MAKAKEQSPVEGAQFVRYFGPLLDALRALGGSGSSHEVVERIAADLKLSCGRPARTTATSPTLLRRGRVQAVRGEGFGLEWG